MMVLGIVFALLLPAAAQAQSKRVMLYTGTTGYRHTDGIEGAVSVLPGKLEALGYTVDREDCSGNGGGANNCDNADKNPRIFTDDNLARYDAVVFLNASWSWAGGGQPGPLLDDPEKAAFMKYVQNGGGVAAIHNSTDIGAGTSVWDWWDGGPNSVIGTTMRGHAASSLANVAQVQVEDHNHLATKDLPDTYGMGDEHYNFARSVRGTHHVLTNLDERTYTPGGNAMGQDHPITWCKLYDGDNVTDGTATPKPYNDGRTFATGMGHFGTSYTENGGDNNLVSTIVGGIRWVAGEGRKSDCSGTVWSSFTRTVLVPDANNPIGIDVAKDGKVYWSEIGNPIGYESTGYIKMYDPAKPAGNKTTVASIPTRADHGNSEDGVLGMSLQPGFDLADASKRNVFVYYSPRPGPGDDWPTSGDQQVVGHNQISRFTLNADGTAVVPGSERVVLEVPKAKISGSPSGFPGGPRDSGPGHVGGAGLDFDSAGNIYLGVGDDVSPNAPGHSGYAPMDYRSAERWDARKTAQNTADLRGKIIRITPKLGDIAADTAPGVDATYTIPNGNLFPVGTAKTRPEIYAMGFRQPFTVHTDPENPGLIGMGEYCHDNSQNGAGRSPAGVCEWNLISKPGNFGWPFCAGDNSTANTMFRWDYAGNQTTNSQYDCTGDSHPSDIRYAPAGQTPVEPTFDGLDTVPGPIEKATIWKKYANASGGQSAADFGDLSAGGMQPITGPIYRYDEDNASEGAFPRYYDGSWLINNRGSDNGFWKEVRLRKDNDQMLRVNDWLPYNAGAGSSAENSSLVIGTQFGPDGQLYMARFPVGCCRAQTSASNQTQIVRISFNVQDECVTDTSAPNVSHQVTGLAHPEQENTYVNSAKLRLSATDVGCANVKNIEYREQGSSEWLPYEGEVTFDDEKAYTIEYRATDRKDNVSAVKTASFSVVKVEDTTAPSTSATLDPASPGAGGTYSGEVDVTLSATDPSIGLGVEKTEYRVTADGTAGDWKTFTNSESESPFVNTVTVSDNGAYLVEYRSTDRAGNVEATKSVGFDIERPVCNRSDEFDGTALRSQWVRHTRNGGTPTTGPLAPTVSGGQLHLPTNDFEIDAANSTTSVGPINFLGQDLPALGDSWSVETQFTVRLKGGWQNLGLVVWNGDNNFFRSTITHNLSSSAIFVESSKDAPTTAEGARTGGSSSQILASNTGPVTIKMRYERAAGANSVTAQYQIVAPASAATSGWVDFPNINGGLDLNPSGGPRRDAAGSRIGLIGQDNWPGQAGTYPADGPAIADVDYFRVTPDDCPAPDTTAPTTTATLDPAQPGPGGTYDRPVTATFAATDGAPGAFGALGPNGLAAANVDVHTAGERWTPDKVDLDKGDQITWKFDEPAGRPHDVWLIAPGQPRDSTGTQVAPITSEGGPSATRTFAEAGEWSFYCSLHATKQDGAWTGMVGTVDVAQGEPGAAPSGVDYTEYRVDGGAWTKGASVTVSDEGRHAVDYRSADKAGNVEAAKSVGFTIDLPDQTTDPPGTASPAPSTPAGPPTPVQRPPGTAPAPKPFVSVAKPARTTVAKFASRRGLVVRITCSQKMTGKASVTSSRRLAKLRKRTLATAKVRCAAGTKRVRIVPSASVRRVLKRYKRSVKAVLTVRLRASDGSTKKVSRTIKLARR